MIKGISMIAAMGLGLAQVDLKPDSPLAIGAWFITCAAVLHGVKTAFDFYKAHIKETPDPRRTYATKEELDRRLQEAHSKIEANDKRCDERAKGNGALIEALRTDMETRHEENRDSLVVIEEKLDRNFKGYSDTHRSEMSGVHQRIDRVAEGLAGVQGEMKHIANAAEKAANSAVVAAEAARGAIQAVAQAGGTRR